MPRIPLVPADVDEPRLNSVFAYFRDSGREVPDLYRTLGNAPALLEGWTRFAWPLRAEADSPRGLRELQIMRVAQLTDAETEWEAHWDMAVAHGNPPEKLAQLRHWRDSEAFDDVERAVLAFTDEMTADLEPSDDAFAEIEARFSPKEIVELTLTAAFYSCVSRVLLTLRIEPHERRDGVLRAFRP